jgi:DNA repair photolyase
MSVLTKGILPLELSSLSKDNEYGITLITLNENFKNIIEPNEATLQDRLDALRRIHEAESKTWVSIEP